jgi:hypothetical protein
MPSRISIDADIQSDIFNTALVADRRGAVRDPDHEAGKLNSAERFGLLLDRTKNIFRREQ